jgi:ribosomal protein S20
MGELPKNFPEYSIMYKTLFKKIKELVKENKTTETKLKIKNYQTELDKIKKMFPEGFFDLED